MNSQTGGMEEAEEQEYWNDVRNKEFYGFESTAVDSYHLNGLKETRLAILRM